VTGSLNDLSFPILTVMVFLPAAGAVLVGLLPAERESWAKPVAMAFALAELALAVVVLIEFKSHSADFQFVTKHSWIGDFGIRWDLGVDGISLFLVLLTCGLFPIVFAGPVIKGKSRSYMGWMLVLEASIVGTFLTLDLFVFFVFFEVTLVPSYFLITGWGTGRKNYAALKFFIYTVAGSAFLLVGILAVVFLTVPPGGHISFDIVDLARRASGLPLSDQELIFGAIAVAFAVKIPLVPFHTWQADAYEASDPGTAVVLSGLLVKLGSYGILRLGVFIFPKAADQLAPVLLTLAVIGIIYAAIVAAMQQDLNRLVAFSSVAHLGFIVLGIFAFTSEGVSGSVLQMVNHGVTTAALFLLVGMIYERRRSRKISDLGGLQKTMPVLAVVFLVVAMSSIGLPGLNGFVGEFLILIGTFVTHRWWAVLATSGVVLSAVYLVWAYQRVFQGPVTNEANRKLPDIKVREMAIMAPLLVIIVFLGVYPRPVLDRIEPSVDYLLAHDHHVDGGLHIPAVGVTSNFSISPLDNVDVSGTATSTSAAAAGRPAHQKATAVADRQEPSISAGKGGKP
jgi:NADH-quinone oxidoreductase subunit M